MSKWIIGRKLSALSHPLSAIALESGHRRVTSDSENSKADIDPPLNPAICAISTDTAVAQDAADLSSLERVLATPHSADFGVTHPSRIFANAFQGQLSPASPRVKKMPLPALARRRRPSIIKCG